MDKSIYNRLVKIEGQVRGIYGMIEEDRPCKEILYQLLAVKSAVDSVIVLIIKNHLERCRTEELDKEDLNEILDLLVKYLSEAKE